MKKLVLILASLFLFPHIELSAQCNTPSNLRASAYGPNFIVIDWDNTTSTSYEIRYVIQGGSITAAPVSTISSKPYNLSGLNVNTSYQIQIREVCTGSNSWSTVSTLSTSCNVVTPPFTAGFSGAAWSPGAFNTAGTINACWQRTPTNGFLWKPGPPQFLNTLTGAAQGVGGSGQFMMVDDISFNFGNPDSAQLYSPLFDLSALSSPRLRFFYHMYGTDIEELRVFISTDYGANYTLLRTLSGQKQFSNNDPWKELIIDLSAYSNDTVRILFESFEQTLGTRNAVCIDEVSIENTPSCPKPQNFQVLSLRNDRASFSWLSGGATNWQFSYGSPNFSVANGTIVNVGTNPGTLTGLSPNTNYEIYVRDSCGAGDVSNWVGPLAFKTACNPQSTPYTENFDANGFTTSSTFNGLGQINSCWTREASNNFVWKPGPPLFSPTNTGPSGDNTTGSAQYIYSETTGFGGTDTAKLTSPLIDLGGLTNPQLTFFAHMFGSDISSLKTYVDNGSGFSLVNTQSGQQQSSKSAAWKEINVALSAYVNDTIQLRFVALKTANGFASDIAIDDVNIDEAPSCPKPQNFNVTSLGATTATLGWQSGGATNWNISYGPPGTTAGNGTVVNTNANPGTLTGLSANTNYVAFVRDSCGPGDVSVWVGPISFQTLCLPISAPYFENFDGTDFSPGSFNVAGTLNSCWRLDTGSNYQWSVEDGNPGTFNAGPNADHTTGTGQYIFSQALFGINLNQVTSAEVLSPAVDLSPLTIPELRFWYHLYGFGIDSLSVYVDKGQGFTYLWSLSGQQQSSSSDAWLEAVVPLSAYANDTIQLKLVAHRNSPFSNQAPIAIDDLRIDEQPSCPQPSNFSLVSTSANSANFSWTSGGANNWQIEYGPVGFNPGNGTLASATSNPFNLTGLSSNTPYQIYVRDSCGPGDVSFWVGPLNFRTDCNLFVAPYFDDLESSAWSDPVAFNDPGVIDPCWSRTDTSGFYFRPNKGASDGFSSGPSGDHTTGSGKYVYSFRAGAFNNNLSTDIETPLISLDTLSNPELRFWYHMFGVDIDKLEVAINNGNGWSTLTTISGQQQTSSSAAWQESINSLSAYVGDTVKFRFRSFRTTNFAFRVNIALDDIRVDNVPTCPAPSNLSTSSNTPTSINLNWTSGGATNWQIQYRQTGSSQPFTIVNVNSRPFNLTGLNPNSSYEIYVRDSCGQGDVSWWAGPLFAFTGCGVSSLPYAENFDASPWESGIGFFNSNDQVSNCWVRNRSNQTDKWGTRTGATASFNTGPNSDVSGSGNYIYFESDFTSTSISAFIRSAEIDLAGANSPKLYYQYHMFGNNVGDLKIEINSRNNGNGNLERTWSSQQQASSADAWKLDSIDLSAYVGDTIRVVFRAEPTSANGGSDIAVDEVRVEETGPDCNAPTNLQVSSSSTTSLNLTWQNANPNGSTTDLIWYEAASGPGSATTVTGISSPYNLTGLNPNTAYVIQLVDSCVNGVLSDPLTDTLSTDPCPVVSSNFTFSRNFLSLSLSSNATNADTVYWYLGNGDSSSLANPIYNYTSPGVYAVSHVALSNCGVGDTTVQNIRICDTLRADFTWTVNNDTVFYQADPSNNAIGYSWDLDEGFTSNSPIPVVVYSNLNTNKTVSLTAWNACGDTVSFTQTVVACDPPKADWTYTILNPINAGLRVQFDGTLSQNASTYNWDFGDGNTGTGPTPIHIYSTPGLFYEVELTVTNNCGTADSRKFRLNQIGLEDRDLISQISVYPNPSEGLFRIDWPEALPDLEIIRLRDAKGALVKVWMGAQESYPISNLPPGLYLLEVEANQLRQQYRLIKK